MLDSVSAWDSVACSTEEVRVGNLNNLFGLKIYYSPLFH